MNIVVVVCEGRVLFGVGDDVVGELVLREMIG